MRECREAGRCCQHGAEMCCAWTVILRTVRRVLVQGTTSKGTAVADMTQGQPSADLMYLREIRDYTRETRDASKQTRNAVRFIAWVVAIVCVISLILGIIAAVQLSKLNSQLNGGGSVSSNCVSQGGTDPSC